MCLKFPEEASLLCFTEELFCGARDETEAVPNVFTVCEKFAVSLSQNTFQVIVVISLFLKKIILA